MAGPTPKALAAKLLRIIDNDHDRLERIDLYLQGIQDEPYVPRKAGDEYRLLAKRAISNWMPLLVNTPAQALYVDGFRPSRRQAVENERTTPEWRHWQDSSLDSKQTAVHRAALTYGHSFTLTEETARGVRTKGLSSLWTAALYEDSANDLDPYAALTVVRRPEHDDDGQFVDGKARLWDDKYEYEIAFGDYRDAKSVRVAGKKLHGLTECPVTRFAAQIDLDGRTLGVIEPMIPLQNRINQTVFDLLVAQTYSSVKVRTVTGMAPEMREVWFLDGQEVEPETEGAVLTEVPMEINYNASRFLFAKDPDAKFGTLDETPLEGFIESIDMSIRHLAAVSQTPPHHLLGQIANLSAEALQAAETSLSRKIEEYRKMFGEAWERVFRLAGALEGNGAVTTDLGGEVLWRDMGQRFLAQAADALIKLKEIGIPDRGLWARVPGVTQNEIDEWIDLREEDDLDFRLADSLARASAPLTSTSELEMDEEVA